MSVLTAVLTHLDAVQVQRHLDYLHSVAPESRFVMCHGGADEEFRKLESCDALFIDDPSLRGPAYDRSHMGVFRSVYENYVRGDPSLEYVYFVEFDHLFLRSDFEQTLTELSRRVGAGLLAKNAAPRNDTNWSHFLRHRDDEEVNRFFAEISCREEVEQRWGCLGTGMLFHRDALTAFCSIPDPPHVYVESFVPSVVHHLGFDVVDVDAHSDLYATVTWEARFGVADVIAHKRAGRTFVHPFKQLDALDIIRHA